MSRSSGSPALCMLQLINMHHASKSFDALSKNFKDVLLYICFHDIIKLNISLKSACMCSIDLLMTDISKSFGDADPLSISVQVTTILKYTGFSQSQNQLNIFPTNGATSLY